MKVKYVNHMGDDLTVVDAARVSFNKKSEWEHTEEYLCEMADYPSPVKRLSKGDTKLVKYLANHGHWTPFAHPQITLHMKLPIFVQRQIDKHQIGFVVNEVSRRYVDDTPEVYTPTEWRKRPEGSVKQGSSDELLDWTTIPSSLPARHFKNCKVVYEKLLNEGAAPEMARMVLPMAMYTESWKTGSLKAWANLYSLRIDGHAQKEIQEVAKQVDETVRPLFPISWGALVDGY